MANRVKSLVFWGGGVGHGPVTSDHSIVVERDFLNSEFNFAGLHLDPRLIKGRYERLVKLEEFFHGVGSGCHVIGVHRDAVAVLRWHVLIHSVVIRRLLDLTCRTTAHRESAPREDSFVSLKSHQFFGLLVKGDSPESVHGVQLEEETLSMKLLYFICS